MMPLLHYVCLGRIEVVQFCKDDVGEGSPLAGVGREHRVERLHVVFIDFLASLPSDCILRRSTITHNLFNLLRVIILVLVEVEVVVVFVNLCVLLQVFLFV